MIEGSLTFVRDDGAEATRDEDGTAHLHLSSRGAQTPEGPHNCNLRHTDVG